MASEQNNKEAQKEETKLTLGNGKKNISEDKEWRKYVASFKNEKYILVKKWLSKVKSWES